MKAQITGMWASPTILHIDLAVTFSTMSHIQFVKTSIPIEMIDRPALLMIEQWLEATRDAAEQPTLPYSD